MIDACIAGVLDLRVSWMCAAFYVKCGLSWSDGFETSACLYLFCFVSCSRSPSLCQTDHVGPQFPSPREREHLESR